MNYSKMITRLCVFGMLCISISITAQSRYFDERSIYSMHFLFPSLVNPGAVGAVEHQQLFVNYRNSWAGFEGSPKTITAGYNGNVGNRLSLGVQLMRDSYGILETNKGQLGLAYTIESEINRVSFGVSTELISHRASGNVNNAATSLDDVLLLDRLDGDSFFDASFGVYGLYNKSLIYGVSFPSLVSSQINETLNEAVDRDFSYIINLGYNFATSDQQIKIQPSIFIKSLNNVPTHVDINTMLSFLEDRFSGGLTYTLGGDESLGFLLGTKLDNLNIYYMYNVGGQQFQDYNNGSHEITLSLNIGKDKR